MMSEIWTTDDYNEYARQLRIIEDAYGESIPKATRERIAAEIVNNQKR